MANRAIVIGAMKSGSTTLFHDLQRIDAICIPDKELGFFDSDRGSDALVAYDRLFSTGRGAEVWLDISTTYSMWPEVDGVPERAHKCLGDAVQLVYLVRNPIERAISHHHHMLARGATNASFEQAITEMPGMVGFGRYDLQAQRWTDRFGSERLKVVRLDDYAKNWESMFPGVVAHLGYRGDLNVDGPITAQNATADARVFRGPARKVVDSRAFDIVYNRGIRRVVSTEQRQKLRGLLLPAPPDRPDPPTRATLERIAEDLAPAVDYVAAATSTAPWDLAETIDRIAL